jgi:hypothetical protein
MQKKNVTNSFLIMYQSNLRMSDSKVKEKLLRSCESFNLGLQFAHDGCAPKSFSIHTQARQHSHFPFPDHCSIVLHESGFCPAFVFNHICRDALSILSAI